MLRSSALPRRSAMNRKQRSTGRSRGSLGYHRPPGGSRWRAVASLLPLIADSRQQHRSSAGVWPQCCGESNQDRFPLVSNTDSRAARMKYHGIRDCCFPDFISSRLRFLVPKSCPCIATEVGAPAPLETARHCGMIVAGVVLGGLYHE
jgi:hypothetical protein